MEPRAFCLIETNQYIDICEYGVPGRRLVTEWASLQCHLSEIPGRGNPIDPKLETDVQWAYFTSMAFDPDGSLRITNEAGKTFLVDVKARKATPLP